MLPDHIRIQLSDGEALASRVAPVSEGYRAWIGIFPFKTNPHTGFPSWNQHDGDSWRYRVVCFDMPQDVDPTNYEVDDYFVYRVDTKVDSLEEVESIVSTFLSDLTLLDEPWRCECPM